jgi:hypothetical protein
MRLGLGIHILVVKRVLEVLGVQNIKKFEGCGVRTHAISQ